MLRLRKGGREELKRVLPNFVHIHASICISGKRVWR